MILLRVSSCGAVVLSMFLGATWTSDAAAQPRRVKAKGQVVAVVGNVITVVEEGKKQHAVRPNTKSPLIEVAGPWKATNLKPGMIIRLTGTIKSNQIEEEVSEVVLHSPVDGYQPGIAQEAKDQPAAIVGHFVRIKDGRLTVAVGKRRINAQLAEEATITVESKDLKFVRAGDAIEFDAYTTSSGVLSARTIQVTIQPPKAPASKQPVSKVKPTAMKRP